MRRVMLLLILAMPAAAAAQGPAPLTLDEAVRLALERNPSMHAARAASDEAAARVTQARAGYLPRVDVMEGWQRSNQPVFVFGSLLGQRRFTAADFALGALNHPSALSNHRTAIFVEQPLFDGGRTKAATRAARLGAGAADLDETIAAANLRLEVVTAFGRVAASRATRAAAEAGVDTAREDLRTAEARRDAGTETEANVLAFRVRLAEAEARIVRAGQDASVARATLNATIGAPLDEERPVADSGVAAPREVDAAALEAKAVASRPELAQAAARRDQSRAAQMAARSGLLPQVAVQAGAETNSDTVWNGASSWSAGVQVRWNLFAGGGDMARVREAAAAARRRDAEYEGLETALRLEVRTATAAYRSALAREAAERRIVEQARESQRMVRDRYEAGLSQAADVLRAAELVAQAEAARTAALMDLQVTAAALDRAVGSRQQAAGSKQ